MDLLHIALDIQDKGHVFHPYIQQADKQMHDITLI